MDAIQDPDMFRRLLEFAASAALTRARDFDLPRRVPQAFEGPVHAVEDAFIGFVPLVKRFVTILGILVAVLCSSIVTYSLFYWVVMPGHHATETLFFDYSGVAKHPVPSYNGVNIEEGSPLQPLVDQFQYSPWAVADLFAKHSQWEHFDDEIIPKPITQSRVLKEKKPYFLEVVLDLPESETNRRTGIFGVYVELQSNDGKKLASSIRAGRLPHESLWVSTVRKIIWLGPLLVGAVEESRRIVVPSFRHFVESPESPLVSLGDDFFLFVHVVVVNFTLFLGTFLFLPLVQHYVTVHLVPRENKKKHSMPFFNDSIEVIRGEIRIGKELSEFQYMLKEWFFTCYLVGSSLLFVVQILIVVLIRMVRQRQDLLRRRRDVQHQLRDEASLNLNLNESQLESHQGDIAGSGNDGVVRDDYAPDDWEELHLQPNDNGNNTNPSPPPTNEAVPASNTGDEGPQTGAAPTLIQEEEEQENGGEQPQPSTVPQTAPSSGTDGVSTQ